MLPFSRFSLFAPRARVHNSPPPGPARGSAKTSRAPGAKKKRRNPESKVRDALAASVRGARTEVPCSSGVVDIVTPMEIIEVKRATLWKAAMGQVLAYSEDFPHLVPRVHLFGPEAEHFRLAAVTCERFGVRLTAIDARGAEVDVWSGCADRRPLDRDRDRVAEVACRVLGDDVRGRPDMPRGIEGAREVGDGLAIKRRAGGPDVKVA